MIHKAIALVATLLIDVLAFKPQKYKNILKTPKNQMEIKFAILSASGTSGAYQERPNRFRLPWAVVFPFFAALRYHSMA